MRLFRPRTKKQWLSEVTSTPRYDSADDWASERQPKYSFKFGFFPAVAARPRPRPRGGTTRKVDIIEPYDFGTALLDIEIHDLRAADPFTDPQDDENSNASSPYSSTRPELHSEQPISCFAPRTPPLTPRKSPSAPIRTSPQPPQDQSRPSDFAYRSHNVLNNTPSPSCQKPVSSGSPASSYYAPFENPSPESSSFRASLVSHAAAQFSRRHRIFFFQLVIVHRWARFIRWDRSGAISTERFDYLARADLLAEFFWRFSHLTDEQRGLDPTVTLATTREKQVFKDAVWNFVKETKTKTKDGAPMRRIAAAESMLENMKAFPISKVHVIDSDTNSSTNLLVGRPLSNRFPMFGRCTRAYIAYDLGSSRLVFLKDTWRADHPKLSVESDTYRILKDHKVPHILDVLYGGDVHDGCQQIQETITQVYAQDEDDWRVSDCKHVRFVHHRIVQEIAYPLESALDVREFVQVLHDSLIALSAAFDTAGLVHRDISSGNVMIDSQGHGVLVDWDHAGSKNEPTRGVGTWRFMSYKMLSQPDKPHELTDDLESVFWLLSFGAMKWYALPDQDLPFDGFDECRLDIYGRRIGGSCKGDWIHYSGLLEHLRLTSDVLHELVKSSRFCWWKFHNAQNGAPAFKAMKDFHAEIMEMLDLASQPTFWIQKFASALSDLSTVPASTTSPEGSPQSSGVQEGQDPGPSGLPRSGSAKTSPKDRRGVKRAATNISRHTNHSSTTSPRKRRKLDA